MHKLIQRPSTEYQYAFDVCAMHLYTKSPATYVQTSTFCEEQLQNRVNLVHEPIQIGASGRGSDPARYQLIVWTQPEADQLEPTLEQVKASLDVDGSLVILHSTWLSAYLPEWTRKDNAPAKQPVASGQLRQALQAQHFRTVQVIGFNSVTSLLWNRVWLLLSKTSRRDWVDRARLQMQRSYVTAGIRARISPVQIWILRHD